MACSDTRQREQSLVTPGTMTRKADGHVATHSLGSGQQVCERLASMLEEGLIRRIGAVPNHYQLGYVANGMTVWNVDDRQVDALGERVGALPTVSHCYRRPRRQK